jgi:hypothetical protein
MNHNATVYMLSWKTLFNIRCILNTEHPYTYIKDRCFHLVAKYLSSYEYEHNTAKTSVRRSGEMVSQCPSSTKKMFRMPRGSRTSWCILPYYLSINSTAFADVFQFTASVFSEIEFSKCPSGLYCVRI